MKKYIIILFFINHLYAPTYIIPNLSDQSVEYMRSVHEQAVMSDVTFKVRAPYSLGSVITWGEWLFGQKDAISGQSSSWSMVKTLLEWALGGAAVSYGASFYVVYRAYKLIAAVSSWAYTGSNSSEEELVLYIRSRQKKDGNKKQLEDIRKDKQILHSYLKLHKHLCKWRIRKVIPYKKSLHNNIVKSYKRLCAAERILMQST